jgi:DNA invertase Pin-like site-specific DNA recombinase
MLRGRRCRVGPVCHGERDCRKAYLTVVFTVLRATLRIKRQTGWSACRFVHLWCDVPTGPPARAAPAALTGALIGYARVSTRDQKLDRQLAALGAAGCIRVFADKKSGKNAEREELGKALDYLRPGDILVMESPDRLGRSLQDLIAIVSGLRRQGAGLRSLKEAIDTTTLGGRLVFHVFAALAEFIRERIVEGLDAARARGQRLGRPPAMTAEQVKHAKALLAQPDASIASIARLLGVSRSTLYKYVPELKPDSQHPELTGSTAPQWGIAG